MTRSFRPQGGSEAGDAANENVPLMSRPAVLRPRQQEKLARSLETIHFGPEYCGQAFPPRRAANWGDGNEGTGDEASRRRERSETADGRGNPGHSKGSGSRRENSFQGRADHNRDRIHLALRYPAGSLGFAAKPGHRGLAGSPMADSRTMTALRSGWRVQLAKISRSPTSKLESIFARLPGIMRRDHWTRRNIQQQRSSNKQELQSPRDQND
jgi:hypothetical protein